MLMQTRQGRDHSVYWRQAIDLQKWLHIGVDRCYSFGTRSYSPTPTSGEPTRQRFEGSY